MNKGYLQLFGGAYLGQMLYNQFLSPRIPAGLWNDLGRAATITATVVLTRRLLK